jgi:cell division protein FtsW (lipid II flippase)
MSVQDAAPREALSDKVRLRLRQPARLRNLELVMLVPAIAIGVSAMALVHLGALGDIDTRMLGFAALPGLMALLIHVLLRITARDADPFILPIVIALQGIGIAEIHRIDIAEGNEGFGAYGTRQVLWAVIGMVAAFAVLALIRNHRVLQRYRYIAMFTAIVLLILPLLPGIGSTRYGARIWIDLGIATFQPGELAKIALAIFFAGYLVSTRDSLSLMGRKILWFRMPRGRDLGPILVVWAVCMGVLVFQRDLGTALLYFGLFLVMIYVATGKASWILLGVGLLAVGGLAASQLAYVQLRILSWLDAFNPELSDNETYQVVTGIFGMAKGGLLGTGLGRGRPELTPVAESDYIIPSLGEELGLIGLFAIFAMYVLLVARGMRIGFAGQDDFGKLLGVGLAFVIALQVFIVIGGVTRVIPLTGLTTPFLAAGGSSLIANWMIVALLLRLSDTVRSQPRVVIE